MPFQSKAQARFMFAQHPEMAKEWASKTLSIRALPQHVKDSTHQAAARRLRRQGLRQGKQQRAVHGRYQEPDHGGVTAQRGSYR